MDFFSLLQHRHHHQRYALAQYTGYAVVINRGMPLALMIALTKGTFAFTVS